MLAEKMDDIYYGLFALILSMMAVDDTIDREYLYGYASLRISEVTGRYGYPYLDEYAAVNAVDGTLDHIGEEYYTSDERASRLAAENAQTVANYSELQEAIENGKNVKIWKTKRDNKVRDAHKELDGVKIGINEYFQVGNSSLLFPCVFENADDLRDVAGCRCSLKCDYDPAFNSNDESKGDSSTNYIEADGFVEKNGERAAGRWLIQEIGGNITLLPENNPEGKTNPDFLWDGKLWDLKTLEKIGKNNYWTITEKCKF